MMMPAFQKQPVQTYHADMVKATQAMLDRWQDGQIIDISRAMLELTMRITALTLFGQESFAEGERIGQIVEQWIQYVMFPSHLLPLDFPGSTYRRWLGFSQEIEQATRRLIASKRAAITTPGVQDDHSLLAELIRAQDESGLVLTEDELIGHISLLLWSSRDASVYAITWTLFLLSQFPAAAEQVVNQLNQVLAGSPPQAEDLDHLPVLERVPDESMRLLPRLRDPLNEDFIVINILIK